MPPIAMIARCALYATMVTLAACAPMRDTARTVLIAPVAAAAWTLDRLAPLPEGPPGPPSPVPGQSLSIYNDRGDRLAYTAPRADGSVDLFRPDASRLGYATGPRLVISPRR